jgi:hypothetical protein
MRTIQVRRDLEIMSKIDAYFRSPGTLKFNFLVKFRPRPDIDLNFIHVKGYLISPEMPFSRHINIGTIENEESFENYSGKCFLEDNVRANKPKW